MFVIHCWELYLQLEFYFYSSLSIPLNSLMESYLLKNGYMLIVPPLPFYHLCQGPDGMFLGFLMHLVGDETKIECQCASFMIWNQPAKGFMLDRFKHFYSDTYKRRNLKKKFEVFWGMIIKKTCQYVLVCLEAYINLIFCFMAFSLQLQIYASKFNWNVS